MSRSADEGYNLYMQLLQEGIDLIFIKEPHIDTSYYKEMQSKKTKIASTGKESTDKLIDAIIEAITEFQNEETKEKILHAAIKIFCHLLYSFLHHLCLFRLKSSSLFLTNLFSLFLWQSFV